VSESEARRPTSAQFDLSGRVALVTGGSRGLGRSIVLGFADAGADVIIVSRKLDACEAVAAEVVETTGRRAMAYACHVGHWDELDALVDAAYAEFGKVDILVNNAGMSPVYDHVSDVTESMYDSVLALNLKGPFRLCALLGTRMAAGDGGSIINVTSMGAVRPQTNNIPYGAAKAGLNHMTVSFAFTFGPKVRVNCIMPGGFLTDIARAWDPEDTRQRLGQVSLGRFGDPDEVVGTAVYLASDASSYTTGAVIAVDGGINY